MIWGIELRDYLLALVVFLLALAILRTIKVLIIQRISARVRESETHVDDALIAILETARPPFYIFLAFYGATRFLPLSGIPEKTLHIILVMWATFQVVVALQVFFDHIIERKIASAEDSSRRAVSGIVSGLTKILLWTLGVLFILSNLGVDITSLLAGVGIGGLALAFAARSLLEDIFSSLAIYFDKPFAPGDFIEVGEDSGTVQRIGIKTTRIKPLSGEELVIPNKKLTTAQIRNFRHVKVRRVSFDLPIAANTPKAKLEKLSEIAESATSELEHTNFKWARVHAISGEAITYGVVFTIDTDSFEEYMEIREQALLAMFAALQEEGIALAPSQRVSVKKV